MGLLSPAILFAFILLFGADSYEWWGDHFHYELTNRYIFSQLPTDTLLGPLWRDDILSGNVWAISIGPAPLAIVIVSGRLLHLSPLGLELVGNLTLYFVSVISMYLYLRMVLSFCLETATAASVMFAATAFWISHLVGNPDLPMAIACIPALLIMAHRVDEATHSGDGIRLPLPIIGLSLLFYACAIHSTLASLPITPILVASYCLYVFGWKTSFWTLLGLGLGLVLYSPFLWMYIEAAGLSHRYAGVGLFSDPFNPQAPLEPSAWLIQARLMVSRLMLGHNQYGLYLTGILVILILFCLGPRLDQEQPRLRKILLFAVGSSAAIYAIELFESAIDYGKLNVPLLGGWRVKRFQYASFFGMLTLVAWMLDRTIFCSINTIPSAKQLAATRVAIFATGIIGALQISYSAYRMTQVPVNVYPQNLLLYSGLFLYAVITYFILVILYRGTHQSLGQFNITGTDSDRLWCCALIVLSVSLATSVHAYRHGVVGMRGSDLKITNEAIMSFRERYLVPDEIMTIKRLNASDSRVIDLTRPWYKPEIGPAGETTLLPLAGLRTPSGFNFVYPEWYGRFVYIGINGTSGGPESIVQIENTGRTNFEALGLLDVRYVLAKRNAQLPGYVPLTHFESDGKALYVAEEPSLVRPAFLSPEVRCFSNENEALSYIHNTDLRQLRTRAVLVSIDAGVESLCSKGLETIARKGDSQISVYRGVDRVDIAIANSTGGILTLSDTYYPGWRVFVNGIERPLIRTYTTFRGVVLGPGDQSVTFIYDPALFKRLYRLSNGLLFVLLLLTAMTAGWNYHRHQPLQRSFAGPA
jgi:hypothetical protein